MLAGVELLQSLRQRCPSIATRARPKQFREADGNAEVVQGINPIMAK